jgi:hypothetical protein
MSKDDIFLVVHVFGVLIVAYVLCVDRLTYILDVSPASENKSVPVGLAAVAATEDPRYVVVAQVSFWRLGDGSS